MFGLFIHFPSKSRFPGALPIFILGAWIAISCVSLSEESGSAPTLLVDAYHAHTWIETVPSPEMLDYHVLHSPSRAVQSLSQLGWKCKPQLLPWTKEVLEQCDVVMLNLPSADQPPYLVDEILALEEFVRNGGGLYIIVDHTNCYFHNSVLGALANRLDIELRSETVCDRVPHTTGFGNAWVVFSDFRPSPITSGLRKIAYQAGGCVDERFGIIFSSPKSWADKARINPYGANNSNLGFYGDYIQEFYEPSGPQAVVAAKELGRGRIVLVADQNCIGGVFLNYADNRRFWLQSMYWAAGVPFDAELLRQDRDKNRSLVWCLEIVRGERGQFGDVAERGLYYFYAWLSKVADARATDETLSDAKVLVVPDAELLKEDLLLEQIRGFLNQPERTVCVLAAEADESLLKTLVQGWVSNPSKTSEPLGSKAWSNRSGSRLILVPHRDAWTNKYFPEPELRRSLGRVEENKLEAAHRFFLGMGIIDASNKQKSWLDELDE